MNPCATSTQVMSLVTVCLHTVTRLITYRPIRLQAYHLQAYTPTGTLLSIQWAAPPEAIRNISPFSDCRLQEPVLGLGCQKVI